MVGLRSGPMDFVTSSETDPSGSEARHFIYSPTLPSTMEHQIPLPDDIRADAAVSTGDDTRQIAHDLPQS